MISSRTAAEQIFAETFASDDNERLGWGSEIWYGDKL
jgi:hypothetical protein